MAKNNSQGKKDPPPLTKLSKKALQEMARPYAGRAMQITAELMESADNDSVRLGAAKTILNKTIPDLKAMEVTGKGGERFAFLIEVPSDKTKLLGDSKLSGKTTRSVS